jgi:phosphoglycolate phosphatase
MTSPRFDVDACIVDLDGTLVDTLGDFQAALNLMLSDLQLPAIDAQAIRPLVGKGSEQLIGSVLGLAGNKAPCDPALQQLAWTSYLKHYPAVNGRHSSIYAGVREGLERLRAAGLRLACLTNKPGAFARPLLRMKALDHYFEHCFGGDAFARKKPDPLPVLMACKALASSPKRTLMVGDSSNDAQAARAAGCPVVLLDYGYNHGQSVFAAGADVVLARIDRIGLM